MHGPRRLTLAGTVLFGILMPGAGPASALDVPFLAGRVNDLAELLTPEQEQALDAKLAGLEQRTSAQIAVLTIPSLEGDPLEDFSMRVATTWKLGRKDKDDGALFLVARDDRKMRIEVGYGLEGSIPDAIAKRIIAERMAPAFKQGDFFGGLRAAVEGLDQAMGGTVAPVVAAAQPAPRDTNIGGQDIPVWAFIFLFGSGILNAIFGLFGSLLAAGIGGWLGFMFFGNWLGAAIAAVVVFLFSLGKMSSGGGGSGGFSSSGGGGFSSGGGGGFSGGGGSFGGGGSSGSW